MITQEYLKSIGLEEEKSKQVIELLGTAVDKVYHEDGYKKAKDEDDLSILTLTKIAKKDNERSSDYHKRALHEYSEKLVGDKSTELNNQLAELNEKLKAKPGDEKLMKEINDLKEEKKNFQKIVDEKVKEVTDKLNATQSEYEKDKKLWTLKSVIPTNLSGEDDYKNYKINQATEKALKDFDIVETDPNGNIILKNSVNYTSVNAKDYFTKELEPIIDKGNQQTGGGANKGQFQQQKQGEFKLDENASEAEKVSAIREHIATQKAIPTFDPRYTDEFNKLLKDNKLDHLMTVKEVKA